jgi:hypothetical protein
MSEKEINAQIMGGAGGDEMSLGDGGALVRDAAESHRLSPIIVDPCLGLTSIITLPWGSAYD